MHETRPSTFLIDITPLFTLGCSKKSIDLTTEYIGGFDKLTDLCCHIAIMLLKKEDQNNVIIAVGEALVGPYVSQVYVSTMHDVILKYARVLHGNFINILTKSSNGQALNHIQVHDAWYNYNITTLERQNVSSQLKATLYWHS